jgi:hypothetical protein
LCKTSILFGFLEQLSGRAPGSIRQTRKLVVDSGAWHFHLALHYVPPVPWVYHLTDPQAPRTDQSLRTRGAAHVVLLPQAGPRTSPVLLSLYPRDNSPPPSIQRPR